MLRCLVVSPSCSHCLVMLRCNINCCIYYYYYYYRSGHRLLRTAVANEGVVEQHVIIISLLINISLAVNALSE